MAGAMAPGALTAELGLHPAVLVVWRIKAFAGVVLSVLPIALVLGLAGGVAAALVGGAAFLVPFGAAAWFLPLLEFRGWRYEIGDRALAVRHGVVRRHESVVPYFRVQHVDLAQGIIERRLGLAKLRVHTAAPGEVDALPGIRLDDAEDLRRLVVARAEAGDGV